MKTLKNGGFMNNQLNKTAYIMNILLLMMVVQSTLLNESAAQSVNRITYEYVDFEDIDRKAMNIPIQHTNTVKDLAKYIKTITKNDIEFIRALYVWFASPTGLSYDFDCVYGKKKRPSQSAEHALRTKMGVCVAYSNIMVEACNHVGIPAYYVTGKTAELSEDIEKSTYLHAWVMVRVNGKYGLIDPTHGSAMGLKNTEENTITNIKRVNNAYFFYHPYEIGERRKSDNAVYDLRTISDFTLGRKTLPNTLEEIIAKHPVFRKYLDNFIGNSMPLFAMNEAHYNGSDTIHTDIDARANYILKQTRVIPRMYFVAEKEYIEMSFTGYLIHIFKEHKSKSKKVITINPNHLHEYAFMRKQLLFFLDNSELSSSLAQK